MTCPGSLSAQSFVRLLQIHPIQRAHRKSKSLVQHGMMLLFTFQISAKVSPNSYSRDCSKTSSVVGKTTEFCQPVRQNWLCPVLGRTHAKGGGKTMTFLQTHSSPSIQKSANVLLSLLLDFHSKTRTLHAYIHALFDACASLPSIRSLVLPQEILRPRTDLCYPCAHPSCLARISAPHILHTHPSKRGSSDCPDSQKHFQYLPKPFLTDKN
ncbi:uncharacterized protein BJ212DRAFT_286561 [Suillus subaureus]|uniref:Uncharacterized protein n=1 Tax=Suillus subaureus TaxID=48587 RepID=A0A9P7EMM7_9AGAM|nr:uncharacterized protein BJ212DRAFT_286561 [Suillus subaureus]KAG1825615.1 hypothetical protein BJ212DRAFT_286561 [Suillus subaureus]